MSSIIFEFSFQLGIARLKTYLVVNAVNRKRRSRLAGPW
jgi:hypothetical protein